MKLKNKFQKLKYRNKIMFYTVYIVDKIYQTLKYNIYSDKHYVSKLFEKSLGYKLDLQNPRTLNEKLQWLKLNMRSSLVTLCSDKYEVRKLIEIKFGSQYLIPIVMHTTDPKKIVPENLPDYPIIIKPNHNSGLNFIIRDKKLVDWNKIQTDLHYSMLNNYYYMGREWQYKNIKPRIIVEKLLMNKNGKIPNDYKFNCINGKVNFIYVSIDREGRNYRRIYDTDWKHLNMVWGDRSESRTKFSGPDIPKPYNFDLMVSMSEVIAKDFPYYVRVDFYECENQLYFGEITLHHGSGFDRIEPVEIDMNLGMMIDLPYRSKC